VDPHHNFGISTKLRNDIIIFTAGLPPSAAASAICDSNERFAVVQKKGPNIASAQQSHATQLKLKYQLSKTRRCPLQEVFRKRRTSKP
jgi:hypothetical protein